jgi:hypothetical protein
LGFYKKDMSLQSLNIGKANLDEFSATLLELAGKDRNIIAVKVIPEDRES